MKIQYAINCKYTFISMYYHRDPDQGSEEVMESVHINYGNELMPNAKEALDHYKHQKRRR